MADNKEDEALKVLVEIVSCELTPSQEILNSEPNKTKLYDVCCICELSSKEIHRTSYIHKTIEPIWTINTKSLFLLRTTTSKLQSGLTFSILHDSGLLKLGKVGKSSLSSFGSINVPYETIISCKRNRLDFDVKPSDFSRDHGIDPKLALRFDIADEKDEEFISQYQNQSLKQETMRTSFANAAKHKTIKMSHKKRDKMDRNIELVRQ